MELLILASFILNEFTLEAFVVEDRFKSLKKGILTRLATKDWGKGDYGDATRL